MDNLFFYAKPERNPVTHAQHRREVFWQITFPVTAIGVVLLALAVLTCLMPAGEASVWADVSLIWLIILASLFTLIFLILLVALVYLIFQLIRVLPPLACRTQDFFALLNCRVAKLCDSAAQPVLRVHAVRASLRRLGRSVRQMIINLTRAV